MDQQAHAYESQLQQSQQQIKAQQRQIEALQRQRQPREHPQPQHQQQHEDLADKLKKYADLKQQGILTEEEFQKLKTDLLSKL